MKEAGVLVHGDTRVLAIAEAAGLSAAGDAPMSCSPTRPTGRPSIWGPSWR